MENIIFAEISEEFLDNRTLQDQFIDQIKELAKNKRCAILLPSKRSYEYWLNNNLDPVSELYDLIIDMAVEIEFWIKGAINFMGNVIDNDSLRGGINIALWEYLDEVSRLQYDCALVFLPTKLTKNLHKNIDQYRYVNLNEAGFDRWNHQDLLGFELNNGGYWFKHFRNLIQTEKTESVAEIKKFMHNFLHPNSQSLLEYKELPKEKSSKEPCAFCRELSIQITESAIMQVPVENENKKLTGIDPLDKKILQAKKGKVLIKNKSRRERKALNAKQSSS